MILCNGVTVDIDTTASKNHPWPRIVNCPPFDILPTYVRLYNFCASWILANDSFLSRGIDRRRPISIATPWRTCSEENFAGGLVVECFTGTIVDRFYGSCQVAV